MTPSAYLRPGISVVTITTADRVRVSAHVNAVLRCAEELMLVCPGDSIPVLATFPARLRMMTPKDDVASPSGLREAVEWAVSAARHQWLLRLDVGERLSARSWSWLRRTLPYMAPAHSLRVRHEPDNGQSAPAASVLIVRRQQQYQPRLWMTPVLDAPWKAATASGVAGCTEATSNGLELANVVLLEEQAAEPEVPLVPEVPAPPAPRRSSAPAVVVIGMHRSGTSLVARLVDLAGVSLGDRLVGVDLATPSRNDNPKGFWESADAVATNNQMLESVLQCRTEWQWTHAVTAGTESADPETATAMDRLLERLKSNPRWGFKDPRTTLTLGAWLPRLGRAAAVLCLRDPRAVAASLFKRDGIPLADGIRIWRHYNESALQALEVHAIPLLVIEYERVIADAQAEVRRLTSFLALEEKLDAVLLDAIKEFTDPELQHHVAHGDLSEELRTLLDDGGIEGEAAAIAGLYQRLREAARLPFSSERQIAPVFANTALGHIYAGIRGRPYVTASRMEHLRPAGIAATMSARPAGKTRLGALPWQGDNFLQFEETAIELCLPPELFQRAPTDTNLLLGKTRPMVEALLAEIGPRRVRRIFSLGVMAGGDAALLNEWFSPEKIVVVEAGGAERPALAAYVAKQPQRTVSWHRGIPHGDSERLQALWVQDCDSQRLDLVIDNATHLYRETRRSFHALFPRLRPGGLYVVESWAWAHWSGDFWQKDRGGPALRDQPPLTNLLVEAMLVSAGAPNVVRRVSFDSNAFYVERGPADLSDDFDLAKYCLNRGDPIPRFMIALRRA